MKYVNCPNCGRKLFEGENGSHIILKCSKCNKLYEVTVEQSGVNVVLRNRIKEQELVKQV